ncbi:hypothetical protein JW872_03235 [Candidatus Babeliales bacterium]|nr:hypothetical protein [Candidatus Babeliales bacterium]
MRRILNEAIGSRSLITKRSELRHLLCLIDHGIQYYIYQEDPDSFLADNAEYVAHLQQQLEAIVGPLSLNTYA